MLEHMLRRSKFSESRYVEPPSLPKLNEHQNGYSCGPILFLKYLQGLKEEKAERKDIMKTLQSH